MTRVPPDRRTPIVTEAGELRQRARIAAGANAQVRQRSALSFWLATGESTVTSTTPPAALLIDLLATGRQFEISGPQWSFESTDLDLTLLTWTSQQGIVPHINTEVDVVLVGIDGEGEVAVNDEVYQLRAGQAVLIAKGAKRSLRCISTSWSYLSIHQRRRGLWPTLRSRETGE